MNPSYHALEPAERRTSVRILRRLRESGGQGILEVLVVSGLVVGLLAVATPAYLGFQSRRADKAAQSNLIAASRAADAYRGAHGSYAAMSSIDLMQIGRDISPAPVVVWARRARYCVTDTVGGSTWSIAGTYKGGATFEASPDCE
jgi:type II secretory pathway pseudopilin PulG